MCFYKGRFGFYHSGRYYKNILPIFHNVVFCMSEETENFEKKSKNFGRNREKSDCVLYGKNFY